MLVPPEPVEVLDLFLPERDELLRVLERTVAADWDRPTVCTGWSVKDLVAHLLADDLGRLSAGRDGHREPGPRSGESLPAFIDRRNAQWVEASRRLSPAVLTDLLVITGHQTRHWFEAIDPMALGGPVSWAGPGPAPVWLDLAREYTERWHHQQQIRDALRMPVLDDPRFLRPVLETFVRALPVSLVGARAATGATVALRVTGPAGGDWTVRAEEAGWALYSGSTEDPDCLVSVDQDTAWRRFVRVISAEAARSRATVAGDAELVGRVLDAVAIIV